MGNPTLHSISKPKLLEAQTNPFFTFQETPHHVYLVMEVKFLVNFSHTFCMCNILHCNLRNQIQVSEFCLLTDFPMIMSDCLALQPSQKCINILNHNIKLQIILCSVLKYFVCSIAMVVT